jgi:two-component system, cell cycle sensor histidine kinase and response regulator CckA
MTVKTSVKNLRSLLSASGFDAMFSAYPDPAFIFDANGHFVDGNEGLFRRTGFTRTEFGKFEFAQIVSPQDVTTAMAAFAATIRGESTRFAATQVTKDNAGFQAGILMFPFTSDGVGAAVVGFVSDIEGRSADAEALRTDTLLLQIAGRLARFGAWSIQVPSNELYWSDELCEIRGFPPGAPPPAERAFALNPGEDRDEVDTAIRKCKKDGTPFDVQSDFRTSAGSVLHMRTVGEAERNTSGAITRIQGASWDVTERHNAEIARREVEERLSSMMSAISDGIVIVDEDWLFLYINPRAESIFQAPAAQLLGLGMWDVFPEGRGTEFAIGFRRALAEKVTVVVRDYFEPFKIWLEATAYPLAQGLAIYFRDVSEQESGRLQLALGERQLHSHAALLDVARDAMIVLGLDQLVVYWNKSAEHLYEWTAAEALGSSVQDLISVNQDDLDAAMNATVLEGAWEGEIEQRSKSGRRILADCSWTLVLDAEGNPESIFAVNSDITERRKVEEGYLRTQRIESLGTLAGGVAHDLNNVLTPILMAVQMLERTETDGFKIEMLKTMEGSVKRGAEMVRQVLSFARGVEGRRIEVDLFRSISESIGIVRDALPSNITVTRSVEEQLWHTVGDPTQILQVLINLVNNAKDAMPDGGQISIVARNVVLKDRYSSVTHLANPGKYVCIEVEDNGSGMPAEVLAKIFEPFFTTKEQGKGTGLGLASTIAIIRSHGGFVQAYSEPGNGSRFLVHLPAAVGNGENIDSEIDEHTFVRLPRGNGELVLVVDDEAAIRQITRQTLEAFGYTTAMASNGAEALDYIESVEGAIDLVLTDMMMPVMDGPTTIREILRTYPSIPIIAASGLAANVGVAKAPENGVIGFLSKPFTTSELLHAVSDALAQSPVLKRPLHR